MRFKNRYYLVELIWDTISFSHNNNAAATAASASAASTAGASTPAASSASAPPPVPHRTVDLSLHSYALQTALKEACISYFGELGYGRVLQSLQVRYLNTLTNTAIIRIGRDDHKMLAAILAFLTNLKNKQVIIQTIHLGGTIRSCQKAAVKLQKERIHELRRQLEAAGENQTPLANVLTSATSRKQQSMPAGRATQQTLRQLANLLTQYKAQQAAAAASSAAAAAAAAASAETTVAPTVEAISAAIDQVASQAEEEIRAMET